MNDDGAARAFGLKEGEGEARWWGDGLVTAKATGRETGGQYTLVEVLEPQGAAAPLHVHHNEDEAFYVLLEGEMTFYVGEETYKAGPGSFVFGPRTSLTPTRSTLVQQGSCSSSHQQALRASSRRSACRRRHALCRRLSWRSCPRRPRWRTLTLRPLRLDTGARSSVHHRGTRSAPTA